MSLVVILMAITYVITLIVTLIRRTDLRVQFSTVVGFLGGVRGTITKLGARVRVLIYVFTL